MANFGRVPPEASLLEEIDGFRLALPGPPGSAPARREGLPRELLPSFLATVVAGVALGPGAGALFLVIAGLFIALRHRPNRDEAQSPAVMLRVKGQRLEVHNHGEQVFDTTMSEVAQVEQYGWEVHLVDHDGRRLFNIQVSSRQAAEWLAEVLRPLRSQGGQVPEAMKKLRGRASERQG